MLLSIHRATDTMHINKVYKPGIIAVAALLAMTSCGKDAENEAKHARKAAASKQRRTVVVDHMAPPDTSSVDTLRVPEQPVHETAEAGNGAVGTFTMEGTLDGVPVEIHLTVGRDGSVEGWYSEDGSEHVALRGLSRLAGGGNRALLKMDEEIDGAVYNHINGMLTVSDGVASFRGSYVDADSVAHTLVAATPSAD